MDAKRYLRLGNDYPYDVLDMVNFTPSNDPAIRAARGVVFDLCDRRDIKRGFENVDEDVRQEIIVSLAEIIREAYKPKEESDGRKNHRTCYGSR